RRPGAGGGPDGVRAERGAHQGGGGGIPGPRHQADQPRRADRHRQEAGGARARGGGGGGGGWGPPGGPRKRGRRGAALGGTGRPFTPFVLDNSWVVEFPTESGVLRLGPGRVRLEAAFGFHHRADEGWYDVVESVVRIADAEGKVWEATGLFMSGALLSPII